MYVQSGVETYHAFSLQVIFRKRALKLVALLRKEMCNLAKQINNTGVTQYQDNQIWGQGWSFVAAGRYFPRPFYV